MTTVNLSQPDNSTPPVAQENRTRKTHTGLGFIPASREEIGQSQWDDFVEKSDEAWLWHRNEYREPEDFRIPKKDLSFGILDKNRQLLLIMPLHLTEIRIKRLIPFKTLNSLGGPASVNGQGSKQKAKLYEFLREYLNKLAEQYDVSRFDICVPPMAPAFRGEQCPRVNPLLSIGCENALGQTWCIDLRPAEDQLRRSYAEGTREDLRKIKREPYEIRVAESIADLKIYYELHRVTYGRSGKPPHPFAYYQHIFDHFVTKGLCRITFYIQNGEVLAGHNTVFYKNAAHYWTAASKLDKPGGANRLLMDEQIIFAKQRGGEWFEAGEASPQLSSGKYKGISDYKKSFGSVLYPFFKGRIVTRPKLHAVVDFLQIMHG